jgi:DNA-binding PadR family transcriptional regulator
MKPQWFHILLALAERDLHGYGIQRAVLERTDGQIRLWPAMLYRSLNTLDDAGLVEKAATPADQQEDERRQYYTLTRDGRKRLEEEAALMRSWAEEVGALAAAAPRGEV